MRRRRSSGHALTEFTLLCGLTAAIWLMPWGSHPSPVSRWFEAWRQWLLATMQWIAGG